MDATTFAAAYGTLRAMHDPGDHLLQTDAQAAGKSGPGSAGWTALAGHVASYHVLQVAGLLLVDRLLVLRIRPSRVAAAVAISASTHALLDRRWPVRRAMELTGSRGFARGTFILDEARTGDGDLDSVPLRVPLSGPYLADQALHHLVLWIAALVLASGRPT